MICNKCGYENPDDLKTCQACGHKLQSGRRPGGDGDAWPVEPIPLLKGPGPSIGRKARKHVEAWAVAGLVGGTAFGLTWARVAWPLYPLTLLAGAYAWWRGITWED